MNVHHLIFSQDTEHLMMMIEAVLIAKKIMYPVVVKVNTPLREFTLELEDASDIFAHNLPTN